MYYEPYWLPEQEKVAAAIVKDETMKQPQWDQEARKQAEKDLRTWDFWIVTMCASIVIMVVCIGAYISMSKEQRAATVTCLQEHSYTTCYNMLR